MKKMKLKFFGIILALALLGIYSCEKVVNDLPNENSKSGTVIVSITDAPFPYDMVEEANITIDWIKLHKIDSVLVDGETDSDSDFVMLEKDTTLNLIELSNGITAVMSELEVPAGTYNEIRFHITEASVKILDDTTIYRLKIPGGAASGLKVKIKPWLEVEEGVVSEVLLDIDVNRSYKIIGNDKGKKGIKGFMFKPVVRAVNLSSAGKVEGWVTNEDGDNIKHAMITLLSGTDTISSTKSTVGGYYAIIGVPDGTYTMECEREGYITETAENVVVEIGSVTQQDFVLNK
jgi:hypothetical protein